MVGQGRQLEGAQEEKGGGTEAILSPSCAQNQKGAERGPNYAFIEFADEAGAQVRTREYPQVPFCMGKRATKRALEYARLAMGFANVRASRYGIR